MLTKSLEIETFRDATCGGAETKDITESQSTITDQPVPPQLDAVTKTTDLVTVSIGGNDFGLFLQWVAGNTTVGPSLLPQVGKRVTAVLEKVHKKAPKATVVLVGYPRLADPNTVCPTRVPNSMATLTAAYAEQGRLNDVMRAAAKDSGSIYIDLFAASAGHGLCSSEPWINGQENLLGVAAAYHPFAVEQAAAAKLIEKALEK